MCNIPETNSRALDPLRVVQLHHQEPLHTGYAAAAAAEIHTAAAVVGLHTLGEGLHSPADELPFAKPHRLVPWVAVHGLAVIGNHIYVHSNTVPKQCRKW